MLGASFPSQLGKLATYDSIRPAAASDGDTTNAGTLSVVAIGEW